MSGLFATLNIGRSGMYSSQKSIDVTSHNISNANTEGYSRQVAKQVTNEPLGGPSMSGMAGPGQVGTGSQIQTIQRIRDSFLDYQVRNETSVLGQYSTRSSYLSQIESIFNEPSDTGISTLIGKFFDSWQELSKQPQSSNNRTVVAQQTLALTDALNHTYSRFNDLKQDAQSMIKNTVVDINSYLGQIDKLNREIMNVKISGNNPNDLMDRRDLLLDQLSSKFNINVDKKSFDGIDVRPTDTNGMKHPELVKADLNSSVARFSYVNSIEKDTTDPSGKSYKITYYKFGDMSNETNKQTLIVRDMTPEKVKELEETRVLWASSNGIATKGDGSEISNGDTINSSELMMFSPKSGELAGNISIQKDINNYMDQLNKLAKAIAFSVNAVHSGLSSAQGNSGKISKDYMPFFVNKDVATYDENNRMVSVDQILNGEADINAGNITINKEILYDVMKIKTRTNDVNFAYASENNQDGESDGARALAIAQLRKSLIKIQDIGVSINSRAEMFNVSRGGNRLTNNGMTVENNINGMTLDGYFKDTIDRLGVQAQEANRMVENQNNLLDDINNSRQSVSGVSLDEEMANLIQFQHAYSANAKIIATVDELLDVVVNGLKR